MSLALTGMDEVFTLVKDGILQAKDKRVRPAGTASWDEANDITLNVYTSIIACYARDAVLSCKGGDVVEIGTNFGLATVALAKAIERFKGSEVYTFDINRHCVDFTEQMCRQLGITNVVSLWREPFDLCDINDSFPHSSSIAFAYVDGSHVFRDCLGDLNKLEPMMHQRGLILCHDLAYVDREMKSETQGNGVRQAILRFLEEHPDWCALRLHSFGLLGRRI